MKDSRKIFQSLTLVLQFGLNMITPIFLCTLAGAWIGKKYGILWIAVPFFIIGALSGFTSIYKMTRKLWKKDKGEDYAKKNQ